MWDEFILLINISLEMSIIKHLFTQFRSCVNKLGSDILITELTFETLMEYNFFNALFDEIVMVCKILRCFFILLIILLYYECWLSHTYKHFTFNENEFVLSNTIGFKNF